MSSGARFPSQANFLRTLVMLITGPAARYTDQAVVMEVMLIVRNWLVNPRPDLGALGQQHVPRELCKSDRPQILSFHCGSYSDCVTASRLACPRKVAFSNLQTVSFDADFGGHINTGKAAIQ